MARARAGTAWAERASGRAAGKPLSGIGRRRIMLGSTRPAGQPETGRRTGGAGPDDHPGALRGLWTDAGARGTKFRTFWVLEAAKSCVAAWYVI